MKKVISFDLDGTLVQGKFGDMVWHRGIPGKYAEKYGVQFEEAQRIILREYEEIGDSNLLWYDVDYWLAKFGLQVSAHDLLDAYAAHIEVVPHALEVIRRLRERYRLVIASNAARIFVDKELAQAGIADHFEYVVSATSDLGMVKKEKRFYHRLAATLGITPEDLVHVGDHEIFDYQVPGSLGIECYHYNPSGESNGNVITDLRELLRRL
ncbi:MAG TPA: HAD family hydrolase [Syntrophorhabdales bacterium]|nr:HAD family hydrolase [Syntrophorhabdales bacterium]